MTLLIADIDDFRGVNDRYGHPAGDAVLLAVVDAMRGDLRRGDVVGRLGGDEFVIALPHVGLAGGSTRAARIQRNLAVAEALPVTLSIGVSTLDPHQATAQALLEDADRALYHVKRTGRFGVATSNRGEPVRVP